MKYAIFCFFFSLILCFSLEAQDSQDAEVEAVIQEMFDGMRAADSSRVHAVIADEAGFYTSTIREEKPVLFEGSLSRFLQSVGSPHDKVYDERVSGLKVHVDDNLATAWMNYEFYLGDSFSHCGVNTMTLHKGEKGWKIVFLADTRRKTACNK